MSMTECEIVNSKLVKPCPKTEKTFLDATAGSLCYNNKCYKPNKKYSSSINVNGEVVSLSGLDYIVKWNKLDPELLKHSPKIIEKYMQKQVKALKKEAKLQEYASQYDLAPQVYESYEDPHSNKYYIVMENLIGYESIAKLFSKDIQSDSEDLKVGTKISLCEYSKNYKLLRSDKIDIFYDKTVTKIKKEPDYILVNNKYYVKRNKIVITNNAKGREPTQEEIDIILTGIVDLHKIGIVHRDLHINNILYNPKLKKVKFIDFGLSSYINKRFDKFSLFETASMLESWKLIEESFATMLGLWPVRFFGIDGYKVSTFMLRSMFGVDYDYAEGDYINKHGELFTNINYGELFDKFKSKFKNKRSFEQFIKYHNER